MLHLLYLAAVSMALYLLGVFTGYHVRRPGRHHRDKPAK